MTNNLIMYSNLKKLNLSKVKYGAARKVNICQNEQEFQLRNAEPNHTTIDA